MANAVQAFVNVGQITGSLTQSVWATFTFANTAGFEAQIPVEFAMTGDFSTSPEIHVFRSTDGGATFETQGSVYGVIRDDTLATGRTIRKDITLDNGWYQIRVMTGSSAVATYTVALTTAELITAYA